MMISETPHCHSRGFTVLEMAISLAISGVALIVLFQLLSTSLVAAGRADESSEASMLARSKLMEVTAVEPINLGVTTGTGPHQLGWRVALSPSEDGGNGPRAERELISVSISIFTRRGGVERRVLQLKSLTFAATE
jgi:prepilin-type N-terminal cleavage/methylation domain-containing protein